MDAGFRAGFFAGKLVWSLAGLALAAAVIVIDYRRLRPYSFLLYLVTLAGFVLVATTAPAGSSSARVIGYTPILFGIALAGVFTTWNWNAPHALLKAAGLLAAPLLLYMMTPASFMEGLEFAVVFMVLFWRSHAQRPQIAAMAGAGALVAGIAALKLWHTPYERYHLIGALTDPLGEGYMTHQSLLALQQAGWWGHGTAGSLPALPGSPTEAVFAFLVYSLGWVTGAAICCLILFFLSRLVADSRTVRDPYGANLITAAAAVVSFRFVWNLLMAIGLLPVAAVDLPFVSYGGQGAVQLALVGLVLGIVGRQEIIRSPAMPSKIRPE